MVLEEVDVIRNCSTSELDTYLKDDGEMEMPVTGQVLSADREDAVEVSVGECVSEIATSSGRNGWGESCLESSADQIDCVNLSLNEWCSKDALQAKRTGDGPKKSDPQNRGGSGDTFRLGGLHGRDGGDCGSYHLALVERLYNPPHICNHARCAANNPDYAVKPVVPLKKYLVAKKHVYGGVPNRCRRSSCDHNDELSAHSGGSSCEFHGKQSSHQNEASIRNAGKYTLEKRGTSKHSKQTTCDNVSSPGAHSDKSWRSFADSDKSSTKSNSSRRNSTHSDVGHSRPVDLSLHKRSKSSLPNGSVHRTPWNSSVSLDKKQEAYGFRSSGATNATTEGKHRKQGRRNRSLNVDHHPEVHSMGSDGRRESGTLCYDSPSASVGSNCADTVDSRGGASWSQMDSSPESCVTSGISDYRDTSSSVRGSPVSYITPVRRYELPTGNSRLPRLSSAPACSSPPSAMDVVTTPPPKSSGNNSRESMSSVVTKAMLAKAFIAKLRESTTSADNRGPGPQWNSSVTVAPTLFDCGESASSNASGEVEDWKDNSEEHDSKAIEEPEMFVDHLNSPGSSSLVTSEAIPTAVSPQATESSGSISVGVPIPESSAEKHIDPDSVIPVPFTSSTTLTRSSSMKDITRASPKQNKLLRRASFSEKEFKILKFRRSSSPWTEETQKAETVNLKRGIPAIRRLSEDYMTDHTLTSSIKRDIQGDE